MEKTTICSVKASGSSCFRLHSQLTSNTKDVEDRLALLPRPILNPGVLSGKTRRREVARPETVLVIMLTMIFFACAGKEKLFPLSPDMRLENGFVNTAHAHSVDDLAAAGHENGRLGLPTCRLLRSRTRRPMWSTLTSRPVTTGKSSVFAAPLPVTCHPRRLDT
ncbi:hypothetical protein C0Q70_02653 [Pomacea canaliculata]|uniref:Uncharacterized protein n=1 Tax=Pomacea canaliculata TaxID=400727 RepID=A0A2T7PQM2_POMCA|nr:hypothetical protein C0Q70_02653 [Pomacea canaliculata]